MEKTYDYIVIGSGFGGSVSSLRLAEKGYSVLTIEKGRRFRTEDFPKTNWNLKKYLWIPQLGFLGFQKLDIYKHAFILMTMKLNVTLILKEMAQCENRVQTVQAAW